MSMAATKVAASLKIIDAENMSEEGRRRIATWLRRQANFLVKEGDKFAPCYRASYRYRAD
jgi:hypothetical protein